MFLISQSWPLPIVHETCKRWWPLHQLLLITTIKSFLDIYYTVQFSHQDIPWDNRIVDQTVPKMISNITHWFNEFSKKFWAKLLITRSSLHSHMQVYTLESGSTYFTYQVKFCVCVLWHISETSTYFWLKCFAPYSEWDYSRIDGELLELCLFHPLYIHANSPRYRTNLLVSWTGNQISQIKVTLNLCTTVRKRPVSTCTLIKTISFFFKLTLPFLEALF